MGGLIAHRGTGKIVGPNERAGGDAIDAETNDGAMELRLERIGSPGVVVGHIETCGAEANAHAELRVVCQCERSSGQVAVGGGTGDLSKGKGVFSVGRQHDGLLAG